MSRFRINLALVGAFAFLTAGAGTAQMSSRDSKLDVYRVGSHLACQCGCKDTVASCSMPGCGFSTPGRARIIKMQHEGVADADIIQAFIKEYGQDIYRSSPNSAGWIVPYLALGLGGVIAVWYVRRLFRPKPALPSLDPQVTRYSAEIEKELSDLDR